MAKDGRLQRFCQQCSRFHDTEAFDGDKKSCREQLSQHNERRRRRAQQAQQRQGAEDLQQLDAIAGSGSTAGHLLRSLLMSPAALMSLKALLGVRTHPALPQPLPLPAEHTTQQAAASDVAAAGEEAEPPGRGAAGGRRPRLQRAGSARSRASAVATAEQHASQSPASSAARGLTAPSLPSGPAPDAQLPEELAEAEPVDPPCYALARQVVDGEGPAAAAAVNLPGCAEQLATQCTAASRCCTRMVSTPAKHKRRRLFLPLQVRAPGRRATPPPSGLSGSLRNSTTPKLQSCHGTCPSS